MGLWNTIKEGAKNLWAEVVTNKQIDKGILDYDRWQEYQKISQSAQPEQQLELGKQMVEQGIIDPILYGNYKKKEYELYAKELQDHDSDISWQEKKAKDIEAFKTQIQDQVKPNYATGDRRQKEVLSKAVEELTKDYKWTYNNVMDTYREYKDDNLLSEWNNVKGEYEGLIKNSAKRFGDLIGQGKSYQDAYKQIISEGKDKANRIVQIQNKLRRTGDVAGIKGAFSQTGETVNPLNAMKSIWKTISNTISAGGGLLGEGVEEGKQALGYYDTLEELSNLGVWKDNEKFKGIKQLQNRAFEVFDGMPQWLPEVGAMAAGNAVSSSLGVAQKTTSLLKALNLAPKTASVSKRGRFIGENLEDFLLYDAVAQASMGRPMTDQDIKDNWLLNIPINLGLSRLVPTEWMTKTLPIRALNTNTISNGLLDLVKSDKTNIKDIAVAAYLDQAYRTGIDSEVAKKKILESVGGSELDFLNKIDTNGGKQNIQDLLNGQVINNEQYDKYQQAIQYLNDMQKDIKRGKITIDDMYMLDLGDRIKATKGKNVGIKTSDEAAIKGKYQYDWFINQVKENPYNKETQDGIKNIYSKVLYRDINNLVAQDIIKPDDVIKYASELPEGDLGRTVLLSKYNNIEKQNMLNQIKTKGFQSDKARVELNAAYDYVNRRILEDIDWNKVPLGTNIGYYSYLGKQGNTPVFGNVFEKGRDIDLDTVLTKMKGMGVNISGKDDTINNILQGRRQGGQRPIEFDKKNNPTRYDVSVIFDSIKDVQFIETKGVLGEAQRILSKFGASYNAELKRFEISKTGLEELYSTIELFEKSGWNMSRITKKQMDAYKIIFIKPYLEAYKAFKKPNKEFYTYFESLFKDNGDGTYTINLRYRTSDSAGKILTGTMKESKSFSSMEKGASELLAEDFIKRTLNGEDINSTVKKLTNQYEIQGLEDKIKSLIDLTKSAKDKEVLTKGLSIILGDILGDRKGNEYIQNAFGDIDNVQVYRKIVSSLIAEDTSFTITYLKNVYDILNDKGLSATRLYQEIEKAREILDNNIELTPALRLDIITVLNKQQILFDEKKIDIPDSFYRQYDIIKTELDGKRFGDLTQSNIESFAKNVSIGMLDRYGIPNTSIYKTIYPKIKNMLLNFQNNYSDIKIKTKGNIKGIAIDTDNQLLYINDIISFHTLNSLLKQSEYEKYIYHHETQHLLNYKDIQKDVELLGRNIYNNIKQIENVSEKKGLDNIVFYNKNTLNESMNLLDILAGDSTELVNKLINLSDTTQIPNIFQLLGSVEEAVTEQVALYNTYKFISDKELVNKIKQKLELINDKLSDTTIIDRWNSIAGVKLIDKEKLLTATQNDIKVLSTPTYPSLKPVKESLIQGYSSKVLEDYLKGVKTSDGLRREKDYEYLEKKLSNTPVIQIDDGLNILETFTSYISSGFNKAMKQLFPDMKNINVKDMLIGENILAKRNSTDKTIPLEIYVTNKIYANILNSMGEYSQKTVGDINNIAKEDIINQSLRYVEQNKKTVIDDLFTKMGEDGIEFKKLSSEEYDELFNKLDGYIKDSFRGEEDKELRYLLEEYIIKQKITPTDFEKQLGEVEDIDDTFEKDIDNDYFSFSNDFDDTMLSIYVDNLMDSITDKMRLTYDVNLIGRDIPVKTIPYNSLLIGATLTKKELEGAWAKSKLLDVKEGKLVNNKLSLVKLTGIKKSFQKGLIDNIDIKVGTKTISFNKQTIGELSPFKILNEFIDTLIGENKIMFETIIDGKSYGFSGSYNFWNSVPGKTILEKLDLYSQPNLIYSKFIERNIPLTDKLILQRIYDTLSVKKGFDKYQDIFRRFEDYLEANKNIAPEELDKVIKDGVDKLTKLNKNSLITEDDLKYIKQKASNGIGGINKFSKDEGLIYSKLQKYLYPKQKNDVLFKAKWLEDITDSKLTIFTKDGYKETDAKIIAIRPKLDIQTGDIEVSGTSYAKDWISTLDVAGLERPNIPYEISTKYYEVSKSLYERNINKGYPQNIIQDNGKYFLVEPTDKSIATDFNVKVNYEDGEFLAKIKSPDGKELNGIAIMEGKNTQFVPLKDTELEYEKIKTQTDYNKKMESNIEDITKSEKLMKSFLVC